MAFDSDDRPSDAPLVESVWRASSTDGGPFTSVAAMHCELVIAEVDGQLTVRLRGPETKATAATTPPDAQYLGIVFKLGTYVPNFPPKLLADRQDVVLPLRDDRTFWLADESWEIPTFENADTFATRLINAGLLIHDPLVADVLDGYQPDLSPRTIQYRFMHTTGLSRKRIEQIVQAQHARELLAAGTPIIAAAMQAGYYDQSHLTNALKRFLGVTPRQITPSDDGL